MEITGLPYPDITKILFSGTYKASGFPGAHSRRSSLHVSNYGATEPAKDEPKLRRAAQICLDRSYASLLHYCLR